MASTYTWSLQSGSLPPGLSLTLLETDLDIDLVGTPSADGTFNFTVRITNNSSGAFFDKAFTVVIDPNGCEITPDLGLPIADMFNVSNPKYVAVNVIYLIDLGASADFPNKYRSNRDLRIQADLGAGSRIYRIPTSQLQPLVALNKKHLFRLTGAPDTVTEFILT